MDGLHALYLRQQSGTTLPEEAEARTMKKLEDVIRTMHLDPSTTGSDEFEQYIDMAGGKGNDELLKDWMKPLSHINPLILYTFGHILMIGSNYIGAIGIYIYIYIYTLFIVTDSPYLRS
jgi:hypothetical protein